MTWLNRIERGNKELREVSDRFLPTETPKERMARVIREFAKIVKLGCSYQEAKWYDGDEEDFLVTIESLSPDAKELLK